MRSRTTLTHVAKQAGVSLAVASRIMGGKADRFRIAAATVERVQEVARSLGYEVIGRSSEYSARLRVSALFSATLDQRGHVLHRLPLELAKAAHVRGGDTIIQLIDEADIAGGGLANRIASHGVVIDYSCAPMYDQLRRQVVAPTVLFNWSDPQYPVDAVEPDHAAGIAGGIAHLAGFGHRRIAYVSNIKARYDSHQVMRLAACRQTCAADGITLLELPWQSPEDSRAIIATVSRPDGPTAILAGGSELPSLMAMLHDTHVAIPGFLSVLSIDQSVLLDGLHPLITAIDLPFAEMAQVAIDRLLHRASVPDALPVLHRHPERLLIRQSTGPVRADG